MRIRLRLRRSSRSSATSCSRDAGGGFVLGAEVFDEGGETDGLGELTPDVGAGVAEAVAGAGGELHEDDLAAHGGFDWAGGFADDGFGIHVEDDGSSLGVPRMIPLSAKYAMNWARSVVGCGYA